MPHDESVQELHVEPDEAGQRLDQWLTARLPSRTRSQVKLAIEREEIHVNEQLRPVSYRMRPGDVVSVVEEEELTGGVLRPVEMPLHIVFEDEHLLVLDKPAGLVVHPSPGHPDYTLVHGLLAHCGMGVVNVGGENRCGLVHRLDGLTSGLLVVAKTEAAHELLKADLAERKIQRRYIALAVGTFHTAEGEIDRPIARRHTDRKRMGIVAGGRAARTTYHALLEAHAVTLLLVRLFTGRTHQIRVHFQSIGRPILGDPEYGWTKQRVLATVSPSLRNRLGPQWPSRQMLHAAGLKFQHPITKEFIQYTSPLPADMNSLVRLIFDEVPIDLEKRVAEDLGTDQM